MLETYKSLEKHKDFKSWKAKHKAWFLSYIFSDSVDIQIGFADKEGQRVTSFCLKGKELGITEDQEVFKKPESKIHELKLTKVKVTAEQAVDKAEKLQKSKYSEHPVMKRIIILQNIEKGTVYNITFVTKTFHTLNIKIDAATARVKEHKLTSLFDFARKE
jgi:hypothetical protein